MSAVARQPPLDRGEERESDDLAAVSHTSHEPESFTSVSAPPEEPEETGKKRRSFWTELPVLVLIAFALALILKTFFLQAFYIPSSSMEPTLQVSDRVLVNKLAYSLRDPRRGEVAVFTEHEGGTESTGLLDRVTDAVSAGLGLPRDGERDFIKRIIGLPGDTLAMRDGMVYINGEPLPESTASNGGYLSAKDMSEFGPVTVPEGHYFMMGDNRPRSADSRVGLGAIPREDLIGRAFVIIWPPAHFDTLPIADYQGAGEGTGSDDASSSSGKLEKEVGDGRRGGPRALRGRVGAGPVPGVPGRGGDVPLPGGDRAALLPRQ